MSLIEIQTLHGLGSQEHCTALPNLFGVALQSSVAVTADFRGGIDRTFYLEKSRDHSHGFHRVDRTSSLENRVSL